MFLLSCCSGVWIMFLVTVLSIKILYRGFSITAKLLGSSLYGVLYFSNALWGGDKVQHTLSSCNYEIKKNEIVRNITYTRLLFWKFTLLSCYEFVNLLSAKCFYGMFTSEDKKCFGQIIWEGLWSELCEKVLSGFICAESFAFFFLNTNSIKIVLDFLKTNQRYSYWHVTLTSCIFSKAFSALGHSSHC